MNFRFPHELWKRLRWRKSRTSLTDLLHAFVNTRGREERRALLKAYPELLDPRAEEILKHSAMLEANRGRAAEFEQQRMFLQLCREVGIDAAFTPVPPTPPGTALGFVLQALVNTPTFDGKKAIIRAHPELLSPDVGERFPQASDERTAKISDHYLRLLEMCRVVGIDAAFAEVERQNRKPPLDPGVFKHFDQVLRAGTLDEMEAAIRQEPRVVDRGYRESIRVFVATKTADRTTRERCEALLRILGECDRIGIALAFQSLRAAPTASAAAPLKIIGSEADIAFNELIEKFDRAGASAQSAAEASRLIPDLPVIPRGACIVLAMLCSSRAGDHAQARRWALRLEERADDWGVPGLPSRSLGLAMEEARNVDPILEALHSLHREPGAGPIERDAIRSLIRRYAETKKLFARDRPQERS